MFWDVAYLQGPVSMNGICLTPCSDNTLREKYQGVAKAREIFSLSIEGAESVVVAGGYLVYENRLDVFASSLELFSETVLPTFPATLLASSKEMSAEARSKWTGDTRLHSEVEALVQRELLKIYPEKSVKLSETENDIVLEGANRERIVALVDVQYPYLDIMRLRQAVDLIIHRNASTRQLPIEFWW